MKRSEIYLKAAEKCCTRYFSTVFSAIDSVTGNYLSSPLESPEICDYKTKSFDEIPGFRSTNEDRSFILLFAHELAKDSGN